MTTTVDAAVYGIAATVIRGWIGHWDEFNRLTIPLKDAFVSIIDIHCYLVFFMSDDYFEIFGVSKRLVCILLLKIFKGVTNVVDEVSIKEYADT